MKKLFTAAFLLLTLVSLSVQAQEQSETVIKPKPHFWWGPKVGVDLVSATTDQDAIKSQFDTNHQFGFFFQFGRTFYLQPEFYLASQKEKNMTSDNDQVKSLRIPLMLGLRIFNLKVISAHIMAGPTASFFLSESVQTPNRQKSSFMLQGGAGADLFGFITLDIRYGVNMQEASAEISQLSWKSGVNMTLGLKFR